MARSARILLSGALDRTTEFLSSLGFTIRRSDGVSGFLKDIAIERGELVIANVDDEIAGELLHEAGHLAVLPSLFRSDADGDLSEIQERMSDWLQAHPAAFDGVEDPIGRAILQCGECEAVAWSYAAAAAIGIDTRIPFFRGFEGAGLELHDQIAAGYHFGIHGLASGGMTHLPRPRRETSFPNMRRWLQL